MLKEAVEASFKEPAKQLSGARRKAKKYISECQNVQEGNP